MKITKVSVMLKDGDPKMKASAYVEIDGCFAIEHVRIIERADGSLFAAMPSKPGKDGKYHDTCHPINEETRHMFDEAIIAEYNRVKDQPVEEKED